MKYYYFNINTDKHGRHEVHNNECTSSNLPLEKNKREIGYCSDCHEALKKAKSLYPNRNFDGCYYCSRPCNKG